MNTKKNHQPARPWRWNRRSDERRAKGSVSRMGNWDRHRIHFLHDPKK